MSETKIHTTKAGSQYIKVGDLIRSEEFKRDCELIRNIMLVRETMKPRPFRPSPNHHWASICSAHQEFYSSCDLCQSGSWIEN